MVAYFDPKERIRFSRENEVIAERGFPMCIIEGIAPFLKHFYEKLKGLGVF